MYPGALGPCALANLLDGIKCSRVYVARLHANDRPCINGWKRIGTHPTLRIDGHAYNSLAPESDEGQSFLHARMDFFAYHDCERRCAKQTLRLNIPTRTGQQRMARGGKRREVRGSRTGDKPASAFRGQVEYLSQPAQGDIFESRIDRRGDDQAGVLIPGGRQPIGCNRHGQRTTDHEAEEAAAG